MSDSNDRPSPRLFDAYAADYESALARGIRVSGEDRAYFVRGRIRWLARGLEDLGERPSLVMDFGCGTGLSVRYLLELPGVRSVVGVDESVKSLEITRARFDDPERARFFSTAQYRPSGEVDLVYSNGVFHHVPPERRDEAVRYVWRSLREGGLFALWENNPWNPGTRYVMRRIPFDRDAIPVSSSKARALLVRNGFSILRVDYLFIFPRAFSWLRPAEAWVSRIPFGAQYQILARRHIAPEPHGVDVAGRGSTDAGNGARDER